MQILEYIFLWIIYLFNLFMQSYAIVMMCDIVKCNVSYVLYE